MTDIQEWINNKYPTQEVKADVKELYLTNQDLEGELDLSEFTKLRKIFLHPNLEAKVSFKNKNQEVKVKILTNAQQWLDKNYPLDQRNKITHLNISYKNLTGDLNLVGFSNLTRLECHNNKLTSLDLSKSVVKLNDLNCADNNLTNLNFLTNLNPNTLTVLTIQDNNFTSDLSVFSHLVNLAGLYIGNADSDRIKQGMINHWTGSLISLQNMTDLRELHIYNTDINTGLEYLPENLEIFSCSTELRPNSLVKKLEKELNKHKRVWERKDPDNIILLNRWKKVNQNKIIKQTLQNQIQLLETERERLLKRVDVLEILTSDNENLIKNQKEKITNVYHYKFEEEQKKDLDELIRTHKNYIEVKKQRLASLELKQQYDKLYYQLIEKLGKDFIEIVEIILTNFEELYQREWDLQEQLKEKQRLPQELANIEKGINEIKKNIKVLEDNPKQVNYITENIQGIKFIGDGNLTIGGNFSLTDNIIEVIEEASSFQAQQEIHPKK